MNKKTSGKRPFFARFLETQQVEEVAGATDAYVTLKYPSDRDESITMKYPSDTDEQRY